MIFRELSNAAFRFSLRRPGAEIMGGAFKRPPPPPPSRRWKIQRPSRARVNYAAKTHYGRRKYDHVSDMLERLGWLGAEGMATYHTVCLTHQVRRCGEPEQLAAGPPLWRRPGRLSGPLAETCCLSLGRVQRWGGGVLPVGDLCTTTHCHRSLSGCLCRSSAAG